MTLEVYHTLFIVFLVITIILFVLLFVFFFVFDIRRIISIKTGWAVKQSVKELYRINQKEDNAKRKKYKAHSVSLYKKQNEDVSGQKIETVEEQKKGSDTALQEMEVQPIVSVTVKLDQEAKETVPLKVLTESHRMQKKPDMEYKRKEEEPFDIVETKIVMFSDEIITKKKVRAEI
ncbi:MAG: hypothetical protein K2J90_09470 [Lachnospiraceae bacterium]|nr:hypothetical protein [Lachnospiraceae bacterium]